MNEIGAVVHQAFGTAVMLVIPIVAAAVVGSVTATIVGSLSGIQDTTVSLVARAAAVVVVLLLMAGALADDATAFARATWARLADVGAPPGP